MTHTTTDAAEARAARYSPTEADNLADRLLQSIALKVYTSDDDVIREAATTLRRLATAEAASGAVVTATTATEDQLRRIQLLADVELHLKSCRIFLTSREKMHPCGVELHDELLAKVMAAIEQEGRNG